MDYVQLLNLRKELGLSRNELSYKTGLSVSYIRKLESGERSISAEVEKKILSLLRKELPAKEFKNRLTKDLLEHGADTTVYILFINTSGTIKILDYAFDNKYPFSSTLKELNRLIT